MPYENINESCIGFFGAFGNFMIGILFVIEVTQSLISLRSFLSYPSSKIAACSWVIPLM